MDPNESRPSIHAEVEQGYSFVPARTESEQSSQERMVKNKDSKGTKKRWIKVEGKLLGGSMFCFSSVVYLTG